MNELQNQPKSTSSPAKKPVKNEQLPADRKILNTLYNHYGKPENILKEKVILYKSSTTPAGWVRPDWKRDEYQMGRVNIYITDKSDSDSLLGGSPSIPAEGKGSWFIGVTATHIKVWVGGKVDAILEIDK